MDEERIREIGSSAKHVRKPLPRSIWILALVIGVACAIGAALIVTSSATPSSDTRKPVASTGGFGMGLGIGLGAGLVIGLAIGRSRARHRS